MMHKKLLTRTASALAIAVAVFNAPAFAQGQSDKAPGQKNAGKKAAAEIELCADASAPCLTEDGMVKLAEGLEFEICAESDTNAELVLPCVTEDRMFKLEDGSEVKLKRAIKILTDNGGSPAAEVEALAQDLEQNAPSQDEPAAESAEAMSEDAPTEPEASVEAEASADANVSEDGEPAETAAEDVTEEPAGDLEQADADAPKEPEPMAESVETTEVAEEPAPEKKPEVKPSAEATAETTTEVTTPTEPAQAEASTDAETTAKPKKKAQKKQATENPVTKEVIEEVAEQPQSDAPVQKMETKKVEQDLPQSAEEEAAAAEAASEATKSVAATAEAENEADVEVTTETVTEENTRSSDEDFETTSKTSAEKDDKGLSTFEKALLGAAGLAVLNELLGANDQVVSNTGDRVVIERDGQLQVLKNDDVLLLQPGSEVRTETFADGSTRTTLSREDGTQVVTVRAATGQVLRRERVLADGTRVILFDDTRDIAAVDTADLPEPAAQQVDYSSDEEALRAALAAANSEQLSRSFSLSQIRNIRAVRELAPEIQLTNVNFATGSAAISATEAEELSALGRSMRQAIEENPRQVFLVEGHTDAVGDAAYNLTLSDRRAESLALALTEYFDVPPENMVVQGYGERYLKVRTEEAERSNRRAAVRIITPLLGEVVAQR